MPTTIESLELEVKQNSSSAVQGIDALSSSLTRLKSATKGGVGLTSIATQLRNLNTALSSTDTSKVDKLSSSLEKLKGLSSLKISSSIGNQLKNIGSAASSFADVDFTGISQMSDALSSLGGISKSTGLQSAITQLGKISELTKTLNTVSAGFSRLPSNIKRLAQNTNHLTQANNNATKSYINLWAKLRMGANTIKSAARTIASWITESNKYIEDLNLFTVALGEYADSAKEYADRVSELLGIDPADWLRNQGVFNTIIKGFGVASDKAIIMSKNLTQLGYDISSFYNISTEEAFSKLQSGIAGELEPLRRLGYDLSVARLQQEAYNLGITKSVSAMTQAEKSQLRYYAIMTQVTDAQGDMARTLNAPANQLRVLQAQVTQCARALGNIFIPALNAVLPYAIAVVKAIRSIANAIANLVGFSLPEIDYDGISAGASAVADSAESAEDGFSGAAKAAKKLKDNLIGIDELNIIRPDDDSSGGGGSGSGSDGGGSFDIDLPTYDFLGDLVASRVDKITQMIKDAMWEIAAVISGFLLVIGTILVVSGANVPLGLGLMAVGAVGLAAVIATNWSGMSDRLAKVLTEITSVLGGFLLAMGAFLVFSGTNVPLGAALMVAGAVSLATAATINWKFLNRDFSNTLSILEGIVSGALLATGALFVLTGTSPGLGIALMIAGAVGLAAAAGLNWDAMSDPMRKAIGTLTSIVGGALLAFGAILAFTGANIPLGVGMIAAGAVSMVTAVTLHWNSLTGDIKKTVATITAIVSGALLGIGAILALSGVAMPLGIAMIAAGAVGIIATASLNWNTILDKIKGVLKQIGVAVGIAFLALGVILCFTGVALPLGVALIAAGAISLVSGIALNWNTLADGIKGVLQKICSIASAAKLALGVILCLSGVGIPLGIALIAADIASFANSGSSLNWNAIQNKVREGLAEISENFVDFKNRVGKKLDEARENINTWASNVKEYFAKGSNNNIKEAADEWGEKFKNGLSEKFKDSGKWVKENIIDPISKSIEDNPIPNLVVGIENTASDWWENVKLWWNENAGEGISIEAFVSLVKQGWETVESWIGDIPTLSQAINLIKSGWETISNWIGNIPILSQFINLVKQGWETVESWIGDIPTLSQAVSLIKSGWTTVKTWIGSIPVMSQAINLIKSGWTTVKTWIGSIPTLSQAINLIKSGWETVKSWVENFLSGTVSQSVELAKSGWSSVSGWVSDFIGGAVSVTVELVKSWAGDIESWMGLSSGGIISASGRVNLMADGGIITPSSFWKSIPMYASGASLHGSMFVAGENGAEMVGHVNGTTEVLNRFQMGQIMYSSIVAGMAQFLPIWRTLNSTLIASANAIIRSLLVSADAVNTSLADEVSYDPSSYLSQSVYDESESIYENARDENTMAAIIRDFYREYVEPTLKEIATDAKKQADKEEQTIVQIGSRTINDAVISQQKANGYVFAK